MYTTIKTLWKKGRNKSEIARATNHDWKTVDKIVKKLEKGIEVPSYSSRQTIIDPYKEAILKYLQQGLSGVRVYEKIKDEGYTGSYPTVRRHIAKIKASENIFLRIHTPPGEEAQVDFGYVGLTTDDTGKKRKTWVFNMRLSYSRLDYYQKVYDQKVETFIACHVNAFAYFGGVPQTVRIDNLKAAILEANFYEPTFQDLYKQFADYYGFDPLPCRIYHPNDKAKTESGIKFVKGNFFAGRTFSGEKNLDTRLAAWNSKANKRVHGTTRKVPLEVFRQEESEKLSPLPQKSFVMPYVGTRKVYHDCHIYVDYNYYSVPYRYVGQTVDIKIDGNLLSISKDGERIAAHQVQKGKGGFLTVDAHYPPHKRMDEACYKDMYRQKMASIGPYGAKMFEAIVDAYPGYWSPKIKGILSLGSHYPAEVVEASIKRAYHFGAYSYQMVKNICAAGTYTLPLEEVENGYHKVQA